MDFARNMEKVCPDAWFLNYSNPMSVLTGAMLRGSDIKSVGLCHSVQGCANWLLRHMDMKDDVKDLQWKIAGINHMSWLLEITDGGKENTCCSQAVLNPHFHLKAVQRYCH